MGGAQYVDLALQDTPPRRTPQPSPGFAVEVLQKTQSEASATPALPATPAPRTLATVSPTATYVAPGEGRTHADRGSVEETPTRHLHFPEQPQDLLCSSEGVVI